MLALVATLAPLSAADAKPKPKQPAPQAQSVAVDGVDLSGTMPNSTRDDLTGDFLGKGYDQRMRVEGNEVNIYDADAKGGKLLKQTQTDLAPNSGAVTYHTNEGLDVIDQFSAYTSVRFLDGGGYPRLMRDTYHLNSVFLAAIDGNLFIAGTKGNDLYEGGGTGPDLYQSLVYRVPLNGNCATQDCATVLSLNTYFQGDDPTTGNGDARASAVTSLAAGYAGGKPYLAVGQSDFGLGIYDMNLQPVGSFGEMNIPGDPVSQTAVTALAWDPAGRTGTKGLLAIGTMDWGWIGYLVDVGSDGSAGSWQAYQAPGGRLLSQVPLGAAIGRRPNDDTPVAAFALSNFTVQLVDTSQTTVSPLATGTLPGGGVAVNAVPRADSTGGTDWAVAIQGGPGVGNVGKVVGTMFRDTGTGSLTPQPLAVDDQGNSVNQLPDAASYRSWFPGYKQGRFRLKNSSADEVTVTLAADSAAKSGCWYTPDGDPDALPADGIVLEPGQTSSYYTLGAYTAGVGEGGCSSVPSPEEQAGAWRAYLSVAPTNRPADTRLVDVQLDRNWTVDATSDQTGGSTTLAAPASLDPTPTGAAGMPYGYQTVTIGGPAAPTPGTAPSLSIHRVAGPTRTSAGVYRVDVGPSTWTVTGSTAAAPQVQAVIPPFHVQGLNGTTWTDIGGFLPLGKLSATTSTAGNGVVTSTVTVGGGTFYWENIPATAPPTTPPAPPPYSQLQVVLGGGTNPPTAGPVTLAGSPTFGPAEDIAQMNLVGPSATGGNATPLPNGVDAVPVQVSLTPTSGPVLPPSDPAYKSVYYRFADGALVTNLYPVASCSVSDPTVCQNYDYDSFVGVQASVTAYPLGGGQTSTRRGSATAYDYVSTTLTAANSPEVITGYPGLASVALSTVATLSVGAGAASPSSTVAGGQNGRAGFSIEGCSDVSGSGTCVLPSITNPNNPSSTTSTPALYQAGSTQTPGRPAAGHAAAHPGADGRHHPPAQVDRHVRSGARQQRGQTPQRVVHGQAGRTREVQVRRRRQLLDHARGGRDPGHARGLGHGRHHPGTPGHERSDQEGQEAWSLTRWPPRPGATGRFVGMIGDCAGLRRNVADSAAGAFRRRGPDRVVACGSRTHAPGPGARAGRAARGARAGPRRPCSAGARRGRARDREVRAARHLPPGVRHRRGPATELRRVRGRPGLQRRRCAPGPGGGRVGGGGRSTAAGPAGRGPGQRGGRDRPGRRRRAVAGPPVCAGAALRPSAAP